MESIREAVKFLFLRRVFVEQTCGVMRFGPLLCEYVGCLIKFCLIFPYKKVNFNQSEVSKFRNFWDHATRPP